ncbi:MAG: hypothetical protein K0R02_538 [Rickettsiaceae bacterium]|jgi:uncharacterized protein (TIGR02217 family)|nr:hypothetical protein [Rickettsiaceae bacterium]
MNGFHDVTLPSCLAQFLEGGPVFNTQIAQSVSGFEFRRAEWVAPIYKYRASSCYLSKTEYEEVVGFFNARQGKAYSFRLRDPFDNEASNQIIGQGDDITKKFQLYKNYGDEESRFIRKINLPVLDSVKLSIGERQINADISALTGEIELKYPLKENEILTASFNYDIKVRFDIDNLTFKVAEEGYIILEELMLVEVCQ